MDTIMLDLFIARHKFGELDEDALRLIVDFAFAQGRTEAVKEFSEIIKKTEVS